MIDSMTVNDIAPAEDLNLIPDDTVVDTLFNTMRGADSLVFDALSQPVDTVIVTAADVFGERSFIAVQEPSQPVVTNAVSGNFIYMSCVAILVAVYFFTVLRYPAESATLFKTLFGKKQDFRREDRGYRSVFARHRYVNILLVISFLTFGIAVARGLELFTDGLPLPGYVIKAAVPLIALTLFLLAFFQYLIMRMAGSLVLRPEFPKGLAYIKKMLFSLYGLLAAPLVILGALSSGIWVEIGVWAALVTINAVILIYLLKSLLFFLSQKVSIFLWILYLCAVELMPLSIVIILLIRLR